MKHILAFILISIASNINAITHYKNDSFENSYWTEKSNKMSCDMFYEIPNYGQIIFSKHPGEDETSKLTIYYDRMKDFDFAKILFIKPSWIFNGEKIKGWTIKKNKEHIQFNTMQTRKILDALTNGFEVNISHFDNHDVQNLIHATISTIGFNESYKGYINCQKQLIPFSFSQLKKSNIYFQTASYMLDNTAKEILDAIVIYAKDKDVSKILLSGHTDNIGNFRSNHKLASQRALAVKEYLENSGVLAEKINIKIYGELITNDSHNNNTESGRKLNRKVNIKIIR